MMRINPKFSLAILVGCLAISPLQAWAGLVFGPSARTQFENFVATAGDTFIDFNSLAPNTNLTTQLSGLGVTFESNINTDGTPFGPVHVQVSAAPGRVNTIVGSPCDGGCTDDGRVGYQILFTTPQRRAGLLRNWNTQTRTLFYSGSGQLLAEHANTVGSEFVGFLADGVNSTTDWVARIQVDTVAPPVSRQVGYSDDLFFGSGEAPTAPSVKLGWNLLGNSHNVTLDVATVFGDATKVVTVWKWVPSRSKWAFYSPTFSDGGAAYAASKGYEFLTSVDGGEGFWVKAKAVFTVQLPVGLAISSASFQSMVSGWSLIAVGDRPTPRQFNMLLSLTPPAAGDIPLNVTTLWAWEDTQGSWYFYAPSMEKSGELLSYIKSNNYFDFGTKVLEPGIGFWVNKP